MTWREEVENKTEHEQFITVRGDFKFHVFFSLFSSISSREFVCTLSNNPACPSYRQIVFNCKVIQRKKQQIPWMMGAGRILLPMSCNWGKNENEERNSNENFRREKKNEKKGQIPFLSPLAVDPSSVKEERRWWCRRVRGQNTNNRPPPGQPGYQVAGSVSTLTDPDFLFFSARRKTLWVILGCWAQK